MKNKPKSIGLGKWLAGATLLVLTFGGCDIINPAEEVPAYLYIHPFTLQTNPATQGSPSQRITDAWLFVNDEFLGAYSLPAVVPVLASGTADIRIEAGIKDNGVNSTPEIYPFYKPFSTTIDLTPGVADTIHPNTTYLSEAKFAFIEGFENNNQQFRDLRQGADANRIQLGPTYEAFEGSHSALIVLDTINPVVELATADAFSGLQNQSVYVYLEVNYKSDVPVVFGAIGRENGAGPEVKVYDPGFLPRDDWNKIYFNLSGLLFESKFDKCQIGLYAYIPIVNGSFQRTEARIWLDNIKLVYF